MNQQPQTFKSANERWYDTDLHPVLNAAAQLAKQRGMGMLAVVEYDPGKLATVQCASSADTINMRLLQLCAIHGMDVDSYVFAVIDLLKSAGMALDFSTVLKTWDDARAFAAQQAQPEPQPSTATVSAAPSHEGVDRRAGR